MSSCVNGQFRVGGGWEYVLFSLVANDGEVVYGSGGKWGMTGEEIARNRTGCRA